MSDYDFVGKHDTSDELCEKMDADEAVKMRVREKLSIPLNDADNLRAREQAVRDANLTRMIAEPYETSDRDRWLLGLGVASKIETMLIANAIAHMCFVSGKSFDRIDEDVKKGLQVPERVDSCLKTIDGQIRQLYNSVLTLIEGLDSWDDELGEAVTRMRVGDMAAVDRPGGYEKNEGEALLLAQLVEQIASDHAGETDDKAVRKDAETRIRAHLDARGLTYDEGSLAYVVNVVMTKCIQPPVDDDK